MINVISALIVQITLSSASIPQAKCYLNQPLLVATVEHSLDSRQAVNSTSDLVWVYGDVIYDIWCLDMQLVGSKEFNNETLMYQMDSALRQGLEVELNKMKQESMAIRITIEVFYKMQWIQDRIEDWITQEKQGQLEYFMIHMAPSSMNEVNEKTFA